MDVSGERPTQRTGLEAHPLLDEMVLYAQKREMAFSLNSSARAVWELCDGKRTVLDISQELERRYDRSAAELLPDVAAVIGDLRAQGLLEIADGAATTAG